MRIPTGLRAVAAVVLALLSSGGVAHAYGACARFVEYTVADHCEARPPACGGSCGYLARSRGDIAGRGAWIVSIIRGTQQFELRNDSSKVRTIRGVIKPGDRVQAVAGSRSSSGSVNVGRGATDRPLH